MGGLGNQMFQISHALCQSWKYNTDCYFNTTAHTPMQANQPSKYINNIFRNIKFSNINTPVNRVSEFDWNDPKLDFNPNQNIEFYGYFQSSKNFLGFDNRIKSIFQPTVEFKEKIKKLYPSVFNSNSISIHVRRGDYSTIPDVLPILDLSYFKKCLSLIQDISNVFVFSDDKEWCNENFKSENFKIILDLDDYEELWLMSLCNTNIISNSTFSWWGSFLNTNNQKTVYSPSVWFGSNGPNPYDSIYEKNWKVILI
jgi:hypothetical protein